MLQKHLVENRIEFTSVRLCASVVNVRWKSVSESWKGILWLMWLWRWHKKENRRPKVSSFMRGFTVLLYGDAVSAQPAPLHFESRNKSPDIDPAASLGLISFHPCEHKRGRERKQEIEEEWERVIVERPISAHLDRQLYLLFSFHKPIKGEPLLHQIKWKTV